MAECTLDKFGHQDSDAGGSMFRGASNININGGTFNAYGSSTTDGKKRIRDAMALLSSCAEHGAPYDAAAREDIPKCHEHTRVAIIEGIQKWASSQDPSSRPLMWIYGPAGSGKTTIMQTVAEIFDKEESLATSFFFSRLSAARPSTKENFVITLAHQLSACIPALQESLADALSDPSLLTKSLSRQLDTLVIAPLKMLPPEQIGHRYIFMVDGLDECEGDAAQRDVLNLLEQCFLQSRHRIRILIASRTLSHIQAFFSQSSIGVVTQTIPLDNDYQSDEDITNYLLAKFGEIRDEHPSRRGLPSDWPSFSNIDILVQRASGQFIYASVVMKFIANHNRHPNESLQTIICLKVDGEAKPYEELDVVYAQVLSAIAPDNMEFISTLMGCMLPDKYTFSFAHVVQTKPTTVVDLFFNLQPGATDARINRMSPLITTSTPDPNDDEETYSSELTQPAGLVFCHASFPEYLLDHSRSKDFFLDMPKIHCRLAHYCIECHVLGSTHVSDTHGITYGPLLLDVLRHCLQAEWTPELQYAILGFDIRAALSVNPDTREDHINWTGMVDWVALIFWAEQNRHISSTDAEHIRGSLQNLAQSVCLELSSSSDIDMRSVGILLTLYETMDIHDFLLEMLEFLGHYEGSRLIAAFGQRDFWDVDDHVREAARIWFCRTLVADNEMNGSFFANSNLYADLALRYARHILLHTRHHPSDWTKKLTIILSKAAPSKELATFLMQNFLQMPHSRFDEFLNNDSNNDNGKTKFFTAVLIYLFESGMPFVSEHRHQHDFHPHHQICGICLIVDPFKVESAEIELSRDPRTTQEDVPLLINPVGYRIPGVPLFLLRTWIFWLADTMSRLFQVAM